MTKQIEGHPIRPRVGRLREQMMKDNLNALICMSPESTFYLSGFNPIIYSHPNIVVLTPYHDPILLTFVLRGEHASASAWTSDIRLYGKWADWPSFAPTWPEALNLTLNELGVADQRVGVEEGWLSVKQYRVVQGALPDASLADATELLLSSRLIKDPDEIEDARVAGHLADIGMAAAADALARPGATERDVVVASMHAMNQHWAIHYPGVEVCDFGSLEGGNQNGLATWVLSGPRKSYACDNPTQRVPQPGETVSVFIWTVANGMHAELERTMCIGTVAPAEQAAIDAILEIREEVAELLRPGVPIRALHDAARKGFERRGYGAYMPGRIGHAIGLGAHESMSIDAASDLTLAPGMILTLEPHLHIVGVCGTQFSDTIMITKSEPEYLTRYPRTYVKCR